MATDEVHDSQQTKSSGSDAAEEMIWHTIEQSGLPHVAAEISRQLDADGITDPKIRGEALIAGLTAAMTPTKTQRLSALLRSSAFWFWLVAVALVALSVYLAFTG